MRALFSRPSQNLVVTACQNDAALVLKDKALFSGPSQHLSSMTRQTSIAIEYGKFRGCDDTLFKARPQSGPLNMFLSKTSLHITMLRVRVPYSGVRYYQQVNNSSPSHLALSIKIQNNSLPLLGMFCSQKLTA
jgi:hypothetical protein